LTIRRGQVKVFDLGIASGTLVNGNRLAPAVATQVANGDRLRVGNLTFEVVIPIPPAPRQPQPDPWGENDIASLLADMTESESEPDLDLKTKDPLTLETVGGTLVATIELIQIRDEESTDLFRGALGDLTDQPDLRRVVLDFQHVKGLGAEASSALAKLHKELKAQRVALELCDVNPRVLTVLEAHDLGPDNLPVHFDRDGALLVPWTGRAAVPAASVGVGHGEAIQVED